jgi:hypothetical protein
MRVLVEGDEILMALLFKLFAEHPSCFRKLEILPGAATRPPLVLLSPCCAIR